MVWGGNKSSFFVVLCVLFLFSCACTAIYFPFMNANKNIPLPWIQLLMAIFSGSGIAPNIKIACILTLSSSECYLIPLFEEVTSSCTLLERNCSENIIVFSEKSEFRVDAITLNTCRSSFALNNYSKIVHNYLWVWEKIGFCHCSDISSI